MALEAHALVTYADVKAYLATATDVDQTFGESLINAASSIAEQYARRRLKARDFTAQRYSGDGGERLLLAEFPIVEVTAVYVDSARSFGSETAVTDYEIESDIGVLWRAASWPKGVRNISVDYRAGYETTPDDLRLAVVETVAYTWQRLRGQAVGVRSGRGLDGIETEYELTIPVNAQRTFEAYRRAEVW